LTTALDARPRLRTDLKIVRREHRGQVQFVVKLPQEGKYYQFGEAETGLMRLMDGEHSPAEIASRAHDALGVAVTEGQVGDFAARLKRLGIVERTTAEQHMMLMERVRSQRRIRVRQRAKGSILRLRFSIGDPDHLFDAVVARTPWLWSRTFVVVSLALFVAYGMVLIARWDEFWTGTANLYLLTGVSVADLALVWVLVILIGGIHEVGHGLTTKWFGGEVHEIGAMMLYFSPALFCNTNDAWTFERRSHRLWVTFAGPWIEMVVAAIGALVWVSTEPGSLAYNLAFLTVLVGGISAVITNFNPLLPLDGYYALSDWLEIPNLRKRSFQYWGWMGRRYLLGVNVPSPRVTPRERRVFLLYGGLALGYSALIAVVSFLWLVLVIGRFMGPWIWVLVSIIAFRLAVQMSGRTATVARVAAVSWRAAVKHRRRMLGVGGLVVVALLVLMAPWTFRARGQFTVAAVPRVLIRAPGPGILDRVEVSAGDTVQEGQVLATLWTPDLIRNVSTARASVRRLAIEEAESESQGEFAAAASAAAVLEETRRELALLEGRLARSTIRAPADGVVIGYRLEERLGERLDAGALLLEIASTEGRQARVRIPLRLATQLQPGQQAALRLPARPGLEFQSRVTAASPIAEGEWVEVEIPFPRSGWQPATGMTGVAKIVMWRGTIADALLRKIRQTVRADLWL
jgi:putative peptide zinc metalloprotease protein